MPLKRMALSSATLFATPSLTNTCAPPVQLLAYVQSDAGAGLQTAVIAALQRFAGGRFDRLTQTGAISALMQSLSGDSAEEYVETLFSSFLTGVPVGGAAAAEQTNADDTEEEALQRSITGRRVWSVEQLCGARHASLLCNCCVTC